MTVRKQLAGMIMASLVATRNPAHTLNGYSGLAREAVQCADALIEALRVSEPVPPSKPGKPK